MYYKWSRVIFLFTALVLFVSQADSGVFNGGFELADPNDGQGIYPPTGWLHYNYATIIDRFEESMIDGRYMNWDPNTIGQGLDPIQGNGMVLLSTGDMEKETQFALITQDIQVTAGDVISGYFFFGTCDYFQWCDYGQILLEPDPNTVSDPNIVTLVEVGVEDVGDYGSMSGWEHFSYYFSEQQEGFYKIVIGVYDVGDQILNSYFLVDGINICNSSSQADFNHDCRVDMVDFGILAQDWLKDCSDPNTPCHEQTDLAGNPYIDIRDLNTFASDWILYFGQEQ